MLSPELTQFRRQFQRYRAVLSADARREVLREVARAMGVAAEGTIPEYPPQRRAPLPLRYNRTLTDGRRIQSKFKTLKQQRTVFALIRAGDIPYRRTGTLGRRWTSTVRNVTAESAEAVIGNNTAYARLVKGEPDEQALYHRGHWTSLSEDLKAGRKDIERKGNEAGVTAVRRLVNRR